MSRGVTSPVLDRPRRLDLRVDPIVHRRRWGILAVLVVSLLVVVLDNTVLNVALPQIQEQLGATQSQQEWIIDSYTVVFAALLFSYGVLGDRIGRRRVLMLGLFVFGAGSVASAYSASPGVLIGMRALMGIGGAAVLPATLAIITNIFDDDERGKAIAIWAGATGLGVTIGPLVGGALLDAGFWWGSVFLINAPIVVVGLVGIAWLVPESRDPHPPRLDPLGVVLSVVGLFALVYGIIRGGQRSDWTDPVVWSSIVGGLAVLAAFLQVERRTRHPALDVRWFRSRAFSGACVAIALTFFGLFGIGLYGMYFFQFDRGYSPFQSGLLMLPNSIAMGVFAPMSARFAKRWGANLVCGSGLTLVAITYATFLLVVHTTPIAIVEVQMFFMGMGMASMMAPATEVIMASLPRERAGAGAAVNNTGRQVGAALGVAVIGSLLSTVYRHGIDSALSILPAPLRSAAGESIGATQAVVRRLAPVLPDHGAGLLQQASLQFVHAMHIAALVSAVIIAIAAAVAYGWLPRAHRESSGSSQERVRS